MILCWKPAEVWGLPGLPLSAAQTHHLSAFGQPLSLPGVLSGVMIVFVPTLGTFVEPRILGGTDGTVIGTIIEDQFFEIANWNFGASIAFLLLALVILSMAALNKAGKRWETE